MNEPLFQTTELDELLEALCEERIDAEGIARLERLVLADDASIRRFVAYRQLHGSLLWDTAQGDESTERSDIVTLEKAITDAAKACRRSDAAAALKSQRAASTRVRRLPIAAAAACLAIVAAAWGWTRLPHGHWVAQPGPQLPMEAPVDGPAADVRGSANDGLASTNGSTNDGAAAFGSGDRHGTTLPIAGSNEPRGSAPDRTGAPKPPNEPAVAEQPARADETPTEVVAFIDAQLKDGWDAAGASPSDAADDGEWLRRVHLDIVGRIPTADVTQRFLADRDPRKRERAIDELLDDPQYVRNWTTVWTNLLVGRSTSKDSQRSGLQRFLRDAFAHNRPWDDVVFDLVSAEGTPEENGASGFLLAHLNNEAVPATAITARVFLGTQVQCTQCHNHPFNDWQQNQFWELNSFFQQTAKVDRDVRDPLSGKTVRQAALVNRESGGPTFFETRSGLMRAAFPRYGETQVDSAPAVNRRKELARLIVESDQRQLARSMINRTWEHFFGAGFTRPVDDMGPHNPPTHPAVLNRLTDEFVASGHDVKSLIRWICNSRAYQLSSRFGATNEDDNPAVGNAPLFSRVYVKSMTAEQLYDSLIVATRADESPKALRLDLDRQRDEWIQQFIVDYGTEENDEALTFDGSIPQALLLMNSELVSAAVSSNPGTLMHDVLTEKGSESDKIRQLWLAALSRNPTPKEAAALRKSLRDRVGRAPRSQDREMLVAEGLQDVFWALLNSNEFVLNH